MNSLKSYFIGEGGKRWCQGRSTLGLQKVVILSDFMLLGEICLKPECKIVPGSWYENTQKQKAHFTQLPSDKGNKHGPQELGWGWRLTFKRWSVLEWMVWCHLSFQKYRNLKGATIRTKCLGLCSLDSVTEKTQLEISPWTEPKWNMNPGAVSRLGNKYTRKHYTVITLCEKSFVK